MVVFNGIVLFAFNGNSGKVSLTDKYVVYKIAGTTIIKEFCTKPKEKDLLISSIFAS